LSEILNRIEQVSVERAYRIVGSLEKSAQKIEDYYVPQIRELIDRWRRQVLVWDAGWLLLGGVTAVGSQLLSPAMAATVDDGLQRLLANPSMLAGAGLALCVVALYLHFRVRRWAAAKVMREITQQYMSDEAESLTRAFRRNIRMWRSVFAPDPVGWSGHNRRALKKIVGRANRLVQTLNDRFTDPSGKSPDVEKTEEETPAPVISGEVIPREETA